MNRNQNITQQNKKIWQSQKIIQITEKEIDSIFIE